MSDRMYVEWNKNEKNKRSIGHIRLRRAVKYASGMSHDHLILKFSISLLEGEISEGSSDADTAQTKLYVD